MTLTVRAASDPGLKRAQNEDSLAYGLMPDANGSGRDVLMVVADGMGGSQAGEVASQLAVRAVVDSYRALGAGEPLRNLQRSVETANRVVHDQSLANPDLRGMGTTCTALVVRGRDAYYAHVGDSRAYLVRAGGIRQLTRDHSLVAQLVESRQITPEQARVDPRRNLVTRSVGIGQSVEIDIEPLVGALNEGDTLLLCTDGLHSLVEDGELAAAASATDLERSCRELVDLARERGGHDNITLILARLGTGPADSGASDTLTYLPARR